MQKDSDYLLKKQNKHIPCVINDSKRKISLYNLHIYCKQKQELSSLFSYLQQWSTAGDPRQGIGQTPPCT